MAGRSVPSPTGRTRAPIGGHRRENFPASGSRENRRRRRAVRHAEQNLRRRGNRRDRGTAEPRANDRDSAPTWPRSPNPPPEYKKAHGGRRKEQITAYQMRGSWVTGSLCRAGNRQQGAYGTALG